MNGFVKELTTRPTLWLCIGSWGLTAAMMAPSAVMAVVLVINGVMLGGIRMLARKGL